MATKRHYALCRIVEGDGKRSEAAVARPVRTIPRPTPLTGWAIIMLGSAIMVLNLVKLGELHLLPGGHTPLWLAAGVAGLLGGSMLIGSTNP